MSSRLPGRTSSASAGCVAIDLGAAAVRVVELEWGKGGDALSGARVMRRGSAPLPAGAWNDLDANREAIASAIQHALSGASISAKSVVACLPRRLVTVRFLRLPHAPPEQMAGMVAFEAQQYILFPLDEVILDHHVVVDGSAKGPLGQDDMDTILLAAARRSVIGSLMAIFDRAGLTLQQLSVSALALAENIADSVEPTALIDLEPGEIDVAVVANRQLMFTRASGVEVHGADEATAQRRSVEEVYRSFTSYQNEFRNAPISKVYYGGADQQIGTSTELERALTDALEINVQPFSSSVMRNIDPDARTYLTAIGVALQTREGNIAGINLVPTERAEKRAQLSRGRNQKLVGAVAVVLALVGLSTLQSYNTRHTHDLNAQYQANQKLDDMNDRLAERQKEFDAQDAMYKELIASLDRPHPAVDVLVALNAGLPRDAAIWITQFSFERDKALTIRGESRSSSAPIQFVLALQRSPAFKDVKLTYLGDSQETDADAVAPAATKPATATTPLPAMTPVTARTPAPPAAGPGRPGTPTIAPGSPAAGPGGPIVAGLARPGGPIQTIPPGSPAAGPGRPGGPILTIPPGAGRPGLARPGASATNPPAAATSAPATAGTPGPVPPVSPPAGGIQPAKPQTAPKPAIAGDTHGTRTSFIITCRVNVKARTLLPAAPTLEPVSDKGKAKSNNTKAAVDTSNDDSDDNGGDDAGTQ